MSPLLIPDCPQLRVHESRLVKAGRTAASKSISPLGHSNQGGVGQGDHRGGSTCTTPYPRCCRAPPPPPLLFPPRTARLPYACPCSCLTKLTFPCCFVACRSLGSGLAISHSRYWLSSCLLLVLLSTHPHIRATLTVCLLWLSTPLLRYMCLHQRRGVARTGTMGS